MVKQTYVARSMNIWLLINPRVFNLQYVVLTTFTCTHREKGKCTSNVTCHSQVHCIMYVAST